MSRLLPRIRHYSSEHFSNLCGRSNIFAFSSFTRKKRCIAYRYVDTPIVREIDREVAISGQHPRHRGWVDLSSTTDSDMINIAVLFAVMKIYRAPSNSRKLPSNAGPFRKNAPAISCAGLLIFHKRNALVAPRQHASSLTGSSSPWR